MKIVNIIGGIGNQMFQYAFAEVLKAIHPEEEVLIDLSHFCNYGLHNGYELSKFHNVTLPVATWWQLMRVTNYMPYYKLSRFIRKYFPKRKTEILQDASTEAHVYDANVVNILGNAYFEGYWQSWKYFVGMEDKIRACFKFYISDEKNLDMTDTLAKTNSVGIHIRRGDYVTNKWFGGICDLEYYKKAIALMLKKLESPSFYIFSNDIDWCKDNIAPLVGDNSITYVDFNIGKNSHKDIYLMSQCKNLIIANSSFSWWSAYLNVNGGIICAPSIWIRRGYSAEDILYPSWTIIDVKK